MDEPHAFESLAGIRPGQSTVGAVTARFGTPITSEASDGGLLLAFERLGIHLVVYQDQRSAPDPLVSEVRLTAPSTEALPCGVRLGQLRAEAINAVRCCHRVTDEYEDAIYFRPAARDDLLASVEFLTTGAVASMELMYESRPRSEFPNPTATG